MKNRKTLNNLRSKSTKKEVKQLQLDFTSNQLKQAFVSEFVDDIFLGKGLKCAFSHTLGLRLFHMDDVHGEAWCKNSEKCRELCANLYDDSRLTGVYHDFGVEKEIGASMENVDGLLLSRCSLYVTAHKTQAGLANVSLILRMHRSIFARIVPQNLRDIMIDDAKQKNRLLIFPDLKIQGLNSNSQDEFLEWFKNWPILHTNVYHIK